MNYFMVAIFVYLVGCLNAGYYYARIFHRQDIRLLGTGTAGARNAGRLYGPFILIGVFLIDFSKGAIATFFGLCIGLEYAALCAVGVVVGHIWPVQLRFQGGKGVASALGALLLLSPVCALVMTVISVILKLLGQTLIRSGIAGIWVSVGAAVFNYESKPVVIAIKIALQKY